MFYGFGELGGFINYVIKMLIEELVVQVNFMIGNYDRYGVVGEILGLIIG